MDSFLMVGQSNMAGRGEMQSEPPRFAATAYMLRNGRWQPLCEPVNPDRPFSGASLATSFLLEEVEKTGGEAGLIPCADGGTRIRDWAAGGLLFDHAVMQAALARRTSTLRAILWHQGESDAEDEQGAAGYEDRLTEVLSALRREAGDVPIVLGEIGEYLLNRPDQFPCATEINAAIHQAAHRLGNAGVASAAGLQCKSDGLHFDTPSLRIFGRRYHQIYEALTRGA